MGLGLLTLLLVVLVGSSLVVSVAILIVVLRVSKSTRMEAQGVRERLAILREQQELLVHDREERRLLLEELERQRAAMAEADFAHPREEPAGGSSGRPSPTPADDQVWTDGLRLLGAARDIHVERYRGAGKSFGARTTLDLAAAGERTGLPAGCDRRKAAVEWLVSDHAIEPEPALRRRGGEPIYRVTRRGFEMLAAEA